MRGSSSTGRCARPHSSETRAMADDERRDPAADRFDDYLDALLGEGRPSPESVADRDEAEMARVAAELAATGRRGAAGVEPDPAFVEQLRRRMQEADSGIASVRTPPPVHGRPQPAGSRPWRLSRRDVLRAGIGAAAGLAAGLVGISLRQRDEDGDGIGGDGTPL